MGHSVVEFLNSLREVEAILEDIYVRARELNKHYIPSRYPNAFESGSPGMYYDAPTAERALSAAKDIVEVGEEILGEAGITV